MATSPGRVRTISSVATTRRSFLIAAGCALAAPPGAFAQRTLMGPLPVGDLSKPAEDSPIFARRKWSIQFNFDKDRESMEFRSLQFASPARGIATAVKYKDGVPRAFLALRTTDGGATWAQAETGRPAYSLHVLDESNAWIVSDNRLLYSDEGGARWNRLKLPDRKMLRVHFQSPTRGWAYGIGTVYYETSDGGKSWTPVKESVELKLNKDNTLLSWMEFVSPSEGMLVGTSRRREEWTGYLPEWMLPERSTRRRLLPGVILTLVTSDGGKSWKPSTTSAFGDLVKVRMKGSRGAGLLTFDDGFDWPSEVNLISLRTGDSQPIFRKPQFNITDIALIGAAGILLAGIEAPGRLRMSALNGKVKAIYSPNSIDWYDMKVDYRAEGTHAQIARSGDDHFWIVSNAGTILKLNP